ncbi:hypothetical protein LE190_14505 [Massilia oculi]|uniref:Uncharacterized protein n=1 Tax=Massilia hydrophila TaxID=3044279 RepID=A0ABS7YBR9_9BURK|nr:hypothetical protein [Massilia oculi]MCA1857129.1 hypothetical protein [Massilia oculi]
MRRVLVIFLILLFPLNVLALSMSASSLQQAGASEHLEPSSAVADDSRLGSAFDDDPDEAPAGIDFHDVVHAEGGLQLALVPGKAPSAHGAAWRSHPPFPSKEPPRVR